ncbi:hypothetical protein [Streptomyces roseus]|uniref:hypothetical protein n=1 Tax=Streptomyces roseus TaxID=66430 RepID=UPI001AE0BFEB
MSRSPLPRHAEGDQSGSCVHREGLTRLEEQPLCAGAELDEVSHAARLAADLDDVAALDAV